MYPSIDGIELSDDELTEAENLGIESFINYGGKRRHEECKMNDSKLSTMFKDPVYTGILRYGDEEPVDLTKVYNFIPMITQEEFLNTIGYDKRNLKFVEKLRGIHRKETKADLLRNLVYCDECKHTMSSGLTSKKNAGGKTIQYYNYRCENPECKYHNKSARAIVVIDFVIKYLEQCKIDSKEAYKIYSQNMDKLVRKNKQSLKINILNFQKRQKQTQDGIQKIKELLKNEDDGIIKRDFKNDIKNQLEEIEKIKSEITKQNKELCNNDKLKLEYPKFLELIQIIPEKLKNNRDIEFLDTVIRKIFSNFYISMKDGTGLKVKIAKFQLQNPFENILKPSKILNGSRTII